jgi:hypothetical protein
MTPELSEALTGLVTAVTWMLVIGFALWLSFGK